MRQLGVTKMNSKSVGWTGGKLYCDIEKYINAEGETRYRINIGEGIFVKGFKEYSEALKFVYRMAWILI